MLSFGDPRPFVDDIRSIGATLICQCQDMDHVMDAVDAGADIIVAQGSEAGGRLHARIDALHVLAAARVRIHGARDARSRKRQEGADVVGPPVPATDDAQGDVHAGARPHDAADPRAAPRL